MGVGKDILSLMESHRPMLKDVKMSVWGQGLVRWVHRSRTPIDIWFCLKLNSLYVEGWGGEVGCAGFSPAGLFV